jgi:pimeloyl-ACP methyl ester carboxylesterase
MPTIRAEDGVELHYEEVGSGTPLIFVHEFAGGLHGCEPQLRFFGRRYRCVAFNARGYPPSGVPSDPAAYSQDRATDDLTAVIRTLGLAPAHVVGLSMGAYAALHLGLRHPELARSLTAVGVGYGSALGGRERFRAELEATAGRIRAEGMATMAAALSRGPARLSYAAKDPRGFGEFRARLAELPAEGAALTMLGVLRERPSLYDQEEEFRRLTLPTLLICGDEDDPALEPSLFLKRTLPAGALVVLPKTGHAANLEEPEAFNLAVLGFLTQVDAGRWEARDPESLGGGIIAAKDP